jgi:hypothetical protein
MEKRVGTDSIGESRSHFNVPPYLAHHDPKVPDGFGDVAFLVEYRVLSANEEQGNYIADGVFRLEPAQRAIHQWSPARGSLRRQLRTAKGSAISTSKAGSESVFLSSVFSSPAPSRPSSRTPCLPWSPTLTARKADISRAISTGHIICYRQCSWCALVIRAGRVLRCAVPVFSNKRKSLFSPLARKGFYR